MTEFAIEVEGLTKSYLTDKSRNKKNALDNLNFSVPKGAIFGLLGPNGAGKSTLINILAGTVVKTSGSARIMGIDIENSPKAARLKIGVVPQEIVADSFFPLYQALEFYAGYYGIRPKNRRTDEILKSLSIFDKRKNLPMQLSGGMKRRFLIAKALVHDPEVIILDEPTAGVDIELRNQLWEFVRTLNKLGKTIIITTHYLAEAQNLCDHIAFINHGKLIKQDKKDKLLKELGSRFLDVEFNEAIEEDKIKKLYSKFELLDNNKVRFHVDIEKNNFDEILSAIRNTQQRINDLRVIQPDLEDIFHKIVK